MAIKGAIIGDIIGSQYEFNLNGQEAPPLRRRDELPVNRKADFLLDLRLCLCNV
jgi:hypothetical protein